MVEIPVGLNRPPDHFGPNLIDTANDLVFWSFTQIGKTGPCGSSSHLGKIHSGRCGSIELDCAV